MGDASRSLKMTESHTYVNTGPAAAKTDDTADISFLTDAKIYYNLPPPLPSGHCRGASLPRGHFSAHHQLARGSSSCPASPKLLTAFPPPRPDVNRHEKGAREAPTPPTRPSPVVTPRRSDAAQEGFGKATRSPPLKARAAKPRGKLSHTRSFDLDHIYQNLVRVASKPRSNSFSIDLPWRRKKKVVDVTPPGIREDSGEDGHIGLVQNEAGPSNEPEPPKEPVSLAPITGDYLGLCNSSSSSSSSNGSENDGVAGDCTAEMRPGVTYLRKRGHRAETEKNSTQGEAVNMLYHTTATLPMPAERSTQGVSGPVDAPQSGVDQRPVLDVNANLDEWLRKERWLEKKRCSRNFRSTSK